jgi:hypothetical protein
MRVVVLALALAGCSTSSSAPGEHGASGDDAGPGDGRCTLALRHAPEVVALPDARVTVTAVAIDVPGVPGYLWRVQRDAVEVSFEPAQPDGSQISFSAATAGAYTVDLELTGTLAPCSATSGAINVRAPGARTAPLRLRVVPAAAIGAPPYEKTIEVHGGASAAVPSVIVDRGVAVALQVNGPSGAGVPAYVRLSPGSAPDLAVEVFADALGRADLRLWTEAHGVVVIPRSAAIAPQRIAGWSPFTRTVTLAAGSTITGTVLDPQGAPIAGATVELRIDGAPSMPAVTTATGAFSVRGLTGAGPQVVIEVTPPAALGLPRLTALSAALDLGAPLQIRYAPGLVRRDLAGTQVVRQAAPIAGAQVLVVGAVAVAGMVTAGPTVNAAGVVRIGGTADAAGRLPTMRVPAAALSAVVTVAPGDLAVAALDTTAGVPGNLDAPAMLPVTTQALSAAGAALPGAVLELAPTGALALAGVAARRIVATTAATIHTALAAGGHYDLRWLDPAMRAAPRVVSDVTAGSIASSYRLTAAVRLTGVVKLDAGVLGNASVQILCTVCTGIDRERPLAEAVTDEAGRYTVAAPDPGTM